MPAQSTHNGFLLRLVVDLAMALHLVAAAGYWLLSPKGFPVDSSRFWLNSVLPIILIAVACIGLVAVHRRKWAIAADTVLCFATAWCAGAIGGRMLFPISLGGLWLVALAISAAGFICFFGLARGEARSYRLWILSAGLSALAGMFAIWAQVPLPASTKPVNANPPRLVTRDGDAMTSSHLPLSERYRFDSAGAVLSLTTESIRIDCRPLLNFDRVSPDRFWSLFAPGINKRRSLWKQSSSERVHRIQYTDNSIVEVYAPNESGALQLTAYTPVTEDTFSHLNDYCYFEISGHERLSLSFSPCRDAEIEVLPADYPTGRPARLAYLDISSNFYVVEAESGEKGPFRTLARGKLEPSEPLTVFVLDDGQPVANVTLEDWSEQVSTDLSPTAGWGLPVNAIEFQRGDDPSSPVMIWVTLAATSVGRGWEVVGHRAGIYRNRLKFELQGPRKDSNGRE